VQAIVIGMTMEWNFRDLAIANAYLSDEKIKFVATNDDIVWKPGNSNRGMPDIGAIVQAHEVASGREATLVGKPNPYAWKVISS
jgi:ribonucleotide monophosphatase NagD (HAD superfamily)